MIAVVDKLLKSGAAERALKKGLRKTERVLRELRKAREIDPAIMNIPCDAPLRWKRMIEEEQARKRLGL